MYARMISFYYRKVTKHTLDTSTFENNFENNFENKFGNRFDDFRISLKNYHTQIICILLLMWIQY